MSSPPSSASRSRVPRPCVRALISFRPGVGQSGAVKRILQEIREMRQAGSGDFVAAPLDDNMFDWHFTIRGPRDTEFEGGIYHGRIVLSVVSYAAVETAPSLIVRDHPGRATTRSNRPT